MNGAVEVVHNKKYIEDIELDKAKWVEVRYEHLNLFNEKV